MEVALVYDKTVTINEECLKLGGAFFIHKSKPVAYDKKTIEKIYEILKNIGNPVMLDIGASTGLLLC
jgi:hypothetical protein